MTISLSRSPSIAAGGATAQEVKVGRRSYSLPPGLKFSHGTSGAKLLWAMDTLHGNKIFAFTEGGEIRGIPQELQILVRQKVFGCSDEEVA